MKGWPKNNLGIRENKVQPLLWQVEEIEKKLLNNHDEFLYPPAAFDNLPAAPKDFEPVASVHRSQLERMLEIIRLRFITLVGRASQ